MRAASRRFDIPSLHRRTKCFFFHFSDLKSTANHLSGSNVFRPCRQRIILCRAERASRPRTSSNFGIRWRRRNDAKARIVAQRLPSPPWEQPHNIRPRALGVGGGKEHPNTERGVSLEPSWSNTSGSPPTTRMGGRRGLSSRARLLRQSGERKSKGESGSSCVAEYLI